jgi:transcriptional regulator with XRE-family HTH domain
MYDDAEILRNFGAKIKKTRILSGLRQSDLATLVGVKQGAISELEQGKTNISLTFALKVLDVLSLSIVDLHEAERVFEADAKSSRPLYAIPAHLDILDADDVSELNANSLHRPRSSS